MELRRRPAGIRTGRGGIEEEEEEESGGRRREGREEEPMSPAARLFHAPHFNCHIIAIIGSGKEIDVDAIKAGIRATLARHPRFCSIQVLDDETEGKKARWVRTEVEVEKHLVIPDLHPDDEGGDTTAAADRLLEDYVASLCRSTMDASRPLWEFHILNFPTSEAAAVAVFRVHHSLGDGASLMSLLLACFRRTSDPDALPSLPEPHRPPRSPSAVSPPPALGHSALQGTEFHPKRFVHRTICLHHVKAIKNAMHCTINDVLVGVASAGFSRYLSRRYGESGRRLPENIRMRSTLLVNMRPTPTIHAMAAAMEEGNTSGDRWGNLLGYLLLPFPVAMYKDPLEYVRKGKAIADRKKNSMEALFTHRSAAVVFKHCGFKAAAALSKRVLSNTTLSFSNIIGPTEEIEFYGHPMVYLAPTVYGHPHALTLTLVSYMNTMKVVLAVDELAIPDPHQLLEDFADSLELIKEALPTRT
ncbi:hypothetical protein OPV22_015790 [Ensete ventricosum]|uniref:Diacylglycerol O-acyltransferase n=1 Tax=Ensete ventricosum TaxID=4639 RepID=A0AAV8R6F9_ENSVE|nr:hypothetical protein OPV22_015790 [Ensete ventricosum]